MNYKKPGEKRTAAYALAVTATEKNRRSRIKRGSNDGTEFKWDRNRILGSKAFRRLAGKAQVYITGVDDHLRTRLTHTLEVSQIARTIAAPLKLDLDLAEAIALGHDLGHTPFGHVGERTLHELMTPQENHILGPRCPMASPADPMAFADLQGFKHNLQSLVVAMKLEHNYAGLGMDLTDHTLYGMMTHSGLRYKPGRISSHDHLGYYDGFIRAGCGDAWSLEALLVAQADEIAQYYHDVEDALLGRLITPARLVGIISARFGNFDVYKGLTVEERRKLLHPDEYDLGEFTTLITQCLVNMLTNRMIRSAAHHIDRLAAHLRENDLTFEEFRAANGPDHELVRPIFSYCYPTDLQPVPDGFADQVKAFQGDISRQVLYSHSIQLADARGKHIITMLFKSYYDAPQQLPDHCIFELLSAYHDLDTEKYPVPADRAAYRADVEEGLRLRAGTEGMGGIRELFTRLYADRTRTLPIEEMLLMRTICNHIACMTDAYAHRVYGELYG